MAICLPDPILSKSQNYRLWQGGAFGNKLRAWRTVDEWRDSGFDVPKQELDKIKKIVKEGMEEIIKLKVPVEAHIEVGKNWLEME